MRGIQSRQVSMLGVVNLDERVPPDHPLRPIKVVVDEVLEQLSPLFSSMYSHGGRRSIPPERLLKSLVLMALYSVRSERQFCEQLGYNLLYLWFLDMELDEQPFAPTTFTKNRGRFEDHQVARQFFEAVVERAREANLLDAEHFSVDGSLIEAWGSTKSFRPKSEEGYDSGGFPDFRGDKRINATHESKTDPDAKLYRKGRGREAKLSHMAHILIENEHGLVVDADVTEASGKAEREAAARMLKRVLDAKKAKRKQQRKRKKGKKAKSNKPRRRVTVAADKAYDAKEFVRELRMLGVTPHVAQKARYSAIDGRTTRHTSYMVSQTNRLLTEKVFGWLKTIGGARRSRHRGRSKTRQTVLVSLTALNIIRLSTLTAN